MTIRKAHMLRRARCRRTGPEAGSEAIELTLITPVIVLLVLAVVALGRLADARIRVDDAAHLAARAASLARDPAAAAAQAGSTARAALARPGFSCSRVLVSPDTAAFAPGGQVSVEVTCTVPMSGLALLAVPGSVAIHSTFTSPVDRFRGESSGLSQVHVPAADPAGWRRERPGRCGTTPSAP